MRVAICDDIQSDRQRLVEYIRRYIGENCIDDLELREYDCAEALLADRTMPDVLFLDIYMQLCTIPPVVTWFREMRGCRFRCRYRPNKSNGKQGGMIYKAGSLR